MDFLRLTWAQVRQIVEHGRSGLPDEVCGLISGNHEGALRVIPVVNRAVNPARHFLMDATELLQAFKQIDAAGQELLAIYHSHPVSDPVPSQEDIEAAKQYPGVVHIIVSLKHSSPVLKGWRISAGQVESVELLTEGHLPDEAIHEKLSSIQRYTILLAVLLATVILLGLSLSLLPPAPVLTPAGI